MAQPRTGRIRTTYELVAGSRRMALAKARELTVQQTVEVPAACVPAASRRMVGRIEAIERRAPRSWRVRCSYDPAVVGDSLLQLLHLLYGHASLGRGPRPGDPPPPGRFLPRYSGPAFGVARLPPPVPRPAPTPKPAATAFASIRRN